MRQWILCAVLFSAVLASGCETTKNSVVGTALVTQGVVDDTYNTYKAVDEADDEFEKEYW